MARSELVTISALLLTLIATAASAASPPAPAPVIEEVPFGRFGRSVIARFHVRATPQAAYAVLADHGRFAAFMPMVEESTVVRSTPGHAVVRFRIRYLRWFDIIEVDERRMEPPHRITWHAVEGPLAVSDGSWRLERDGAGTRVTYQTDVDPGLPFPSAWTGYLLRQGLPAFLEAVRARIESGGRWEKAP